MRRSGMSPWIFALATSPLYHSGSGSPRFFRLPGLDGGHERAEVPVVLFQNHLAPKRKPIVKP